MSEEKVDEVKAEAAPETVAEPQVNEVEDKARRMGWVPKDDFKGDPDRWRPADEFVRRGENELPIMRERLRHQDKQLLDLKKTIKDFAEYHSKVEQKAYERAYTELKQRQVEAVSAGDAQAFVKIDKEIEELRAEASQGPKVQLPEETAEENPVYKEWHSRNKWFQQDPDLTAYANSMALYFQKKDLPYEEFLEAVEKKVKAEFPAKFENPRRNSAPSVEAATAAPKKGGKSYADLPADAKKACDDFVKEKLTTRDAYVKRYFEEE